MLLDLNAIVNDWFDDNRLTGHLKMWFMLTICFSAS